MSTSDIERARRGLKRTTFVYLLLSVICIVFSTIYELFSHGVYSSYMIFAFAYPLLGGALPFRLLYRLNANPPSTLSRTIYHAGIAALTIGSIIKGVLHIYGTTNALSDYYFFVGIPLLIIGIISFLIDIVRKNKYL